MQTLKVNRFEIETAVYKGPIEVLLELIETKKLLVNELSLSQVTDDFIGYVKSKGEFPIDDAADFIQVAATLLLIKSRSLIPDLELSGDEEDDIDDLKRRLYAYEKAREAARELSKIFGRSVMVSAGERPHEVKFAPSTDMTLQNLEKALDEALKTLTKEVPLEEARVKTTITIDEMMGSLLERAQRVFTLSFKEFSNSREKVEVIVSFLALLELVKQGSLDASQHDMFADITIKNTSTETPKY